MLYPVEINTFFVNFKFLSFNIYFSISSTCSSFSGVGAYR